MSDDLEVTKAGRTQGFIPDADAVFSDVSIDDTTCFSPTTDLLARKFLASPGHEDITLGFLKDMLGLDISEVVVATPYDIKSYKDGVGQGIRQTIVDVFAKTSDGIEAVIEVEVGHMTAFDKRALYGIATRYVAGLDSKLEVFLDALDTVGSRSDKRPANEAKYQALHPVYGINVLTQNYFKGDDDVYRSFVLYDKEHDENYGHDGIDLIRLAFLELAKKTGIGSVNLLYWWQFLNGDPIDDAAPDYIIQAAHIVDRQNLSAEELAMLTSQQLWQLDREAEMDYAINEGLRRGLEQGKAELIAAMASKGLNTQQIADLTNLSSNEVEHILSLGEFSF
jgi:uncharacterized protein YkuJ